MFNMKIQNTAVLRFMFLTKKYVNYIYMYENH